jgi:hypothetical protein
MLVVVTVYIAMPLAWALETKFSEGDVCKAKCRLDEGMVCLERGPCEPINKFLLDAAKECRDNPAARYLPITKLLFVDVLSLVLRLDKEFPENIDSLNNEERYKLETKLLKDKGIDIFIGTGPLSPLTREELAVVLKRVSVEKDLGFSTGLSGQAFDLKNEKFVIYDVQLYVDEGAGFELWERKNDFAGSLPTSKDYVAKLDSCDDARVVFGDNEKGKIPLTGSRLKALYKYYGREDEMVTECEIAMLLSNPDVAKSLKNTYNPSRVLTKENFVDLLIKTMGLERNLPRDYYTVSEQELYKLQTELLARNGIGIFVGSDPHELLTREELARVLYDSPVEEVLGLSNGAPNQEFGLNNAGFVIYDLHTYVKEAVDYEEWNRRDGFIESSSMSKDYLVKLDSGNYASIYFGDNRKGKIPVAGSPIKVRYRLYAPVSMFTEDDIICVLGKRVPVVEAYEPPPPPPDFPPPADGFDDPATHI